MHSLVLSIIGSLASGKPGARQASPWYYSAIAGGCTWYYSLLVAARASGVCLCDGTKYYLYDGVGLTFFLNILLIIINID